MKRWAIGLAVTALALVATPASASDEETSCQDICIEGCANACSSVCRSEGTRETCEIRCNPACYSACEPRCATPTCGQACASDCDAKCAEDGAGEGCPDRCAARCARVCHDGPFGVRDEATLIHRGHHPHPSKDNAGWCPGQVTVPDDEGATTPHLESASASTSEIDPDAPGTVATCGYAPGRGSAPPILAALGLATAMAATRRRTAKKTSSRRAPP